MKREDIQALAREAAKMIKTEKDISDFSRVLKKIVVETALFELNGSDR
jgi:putative transposase